MVGPVGLVQVDVIGLQLAQAVLNRGNDVAAIQRARNRSVAANDRSFTKRLAMVSWRPSMPK